MVKKRCQECNIEYPATAEFFVRDKTGRDGWNYRCKECRRKYNKKRNRKRYQDNKEKIKEQKRKFEVKFKKEYGISYLAIHNYIKKRKLKPEYCIICNDKKKLELCSIDHTYTRNIDDWIWLCKECHSLFDYWRDERSKEIVRNVKIYKDENDLKK